MSDRYALEPGVRAALTDLGLNPTAVMLRAGLRPDLLTGGPVWLSADEFHALWCSLEAEVDHPNLPLLIAETLSPEAFAPPLFAALMSSDLNTAAQRVAVYKRLVGPVRVTVEVAAEETTIDLAWPADAEPPTTLVLTELLFWVALARIGTRSSVNPARVTAFSTPDDTAAYDAFVGVTIDESCAASVTFAAADAARPFLTANEAIWETFEPQLRRRLASLDLDATMNERVSAVLLELLPVGRATVADVASELAISSRTLHRGLAAENASFQQILNTTREQLALHYLGDPALSAAQIAFLLGYSEASSFYRAFRNWTGETPEQTRSSLLAPQT